MNWRETIEPVAKRCDIAAIFDQRISFDKDGAEAVATLLRAMADRLDYVGKHYELRPGHAPFRDT